MNQLTRIILMLAVVHSGYCNAQSVKLCGTDMLKNYLYSQDSIGQSIKEKGYNENLQRWRKDHSGINFIPNPIQSLVGGSNCTKANYIIPVVVHVVHSSGDMSIGSGTNISSAQIQDQIEILNKAFSNAGLASSPAVNTGIQFCLAQKRPDGTTFDGITRTASTLTQQQWPSTNKALRNLIEYDPSQYLNIYVVEGIQVAGLPTGAVIGGYANFPWDKDNGEDGIVIDYNFFGNYNSFGSPLDSTSEGMTLVHEVGHYLGLYHPFEGGCAGLNSFDCASEGDKCCDVPAVYNINSICPNPSENTCMETYSSNKADQKQNYMDYSPEYCVNTFTANQTDLMFTTLSVYRNALVTPTNVNSKGLVCCINSAHFEGSNFVCLENEIQFNCYEYFGTEYKWQFYTGGSLVHTSTTSLPSYAYTPLATGTYDVELKIIQGSTVLVSSRINGYLIVQDCGQSIASSKGNWYFGKYAGIRFYENGVYRDINPYTFKSQFPSEPQIDVGEGTVSISDEQGNLLFYGGGPNVANFYGDPICLFDSTYRQIDKDTIFRAPFSASQGVIAIPTTDKNIFWLFNIADSVNNSIYFSGLQYSKIDVSNTTTGSYGKAIIAGVQVMDSSGNPHLNLSEGIAATYASDTSYWLFVHNKQEQKLLLYLVSDNAVVYHSSYPLFAHYQSHIKFSPNGRYLTIGTKLLTFDAKIGNLKLIHSIDSFYRVYGACFSPDSKILYRNEQRFTSGGVPLNYQIVQNNLLSSNLDSGKIVVGEHYGGRRTLQLGPDEKIYIASDGQTTLPRINNPNEIDYGNNECQLLEDQVILSENGVGGKSYEGLPNFLEGVGPSKAQVDFSYRIVNCSEVQFLSNNPFGNNYKWYFGDGDSSIEKDPKHQYNNGAFTVKLVQDGVIVQKTIELLIPQSDLQIVGDTFFCDTTKAYEFSSTFNPKYSYNWAVSSGNSLTSVKNKAYVMWSNDGTVSLAIINNRTGCTDTVQMEVKKSADIQGLGINAFYNYSCDTNDMVTIYGNTPTGGNGNFAFEWFGRSSPNQAYRPIDSSFFKDYTSTNRGFTSFYRVVKSNGCRGFSNKVEIPFLQPMINIVEIAKPCFQGDSLTLSVENLHLSQIFGITYSWEKSLDSINWSNLGKHDPVIRINQSDIQAFYRIVVSVTQLNCLLYSNVLTIKPDVYITREPKDYYTCDEFQGNWFFDIGVSNENNIPLQYWWRIKDANSNSWSQNSVGSDTVISAAGHSSSHPSNHLDTVQFVINTSCGVLYSRKAVIRVVNDVPNISYLAFKNVQVGDLITFNGSITGHYDSLKWQVQDANSSQWEDLPDGNTVSFNYVFNAVCYNKYRLVAYNNCGITYSNTPSLTISDPSDIWLKDRPQDVGVELYPALPASLLINSPDIWNRRANDSGTLHQTPDYSPTNPNYIYIKLRNKGTTQTGATPLYLYWTLAEIGQEIWPNDWTDNPNNQLINRLNNLPFPKGSEINEIAIMVPAINPGDSVIVSVPWFPPSPSNYTYAKALNTFKPFEKLNICLLARLEHCEQYPHKMTFNEDLGQSVIGNVSRNNNIATKNFEVVDKDVDSDGGVTGGTVITTFPQTSYDTVPCIKMILKKPLQDGTFILEMRRVYLDDEPTMTFEEYQQIISMDFDTCLVPINPYSQVGRFALTPKFIPINGWQSLPQELFEFVMVLSNNYGEEYGAFEYHIDNRDGSFNTLDYFWSPPPSLPETNHLLLSPNPTVSTFSLELDQETKDNMLGQLGTVIVADGYGYPHIVLENIDAQANTLISLQGYKAGVYNVRFEIGGQVFYKYLVKTDE